MWREKKMIKTIKQIIKEGKNFPAKYPNRYFNQKMYSRGELIKERINERNKEVKENDKRRT